MSWGSFVAVSDSRTQSWWNSCSFLGISLLPIWSAWISYTNIFNMFCACLFWKHSKPVRGENMKWFPNWFPKMKEIFISKLVIQEPQLGSLLGMLLVVPVQRYLLDVPAKHARSMLAVRFFSFLSEQGTCKLVRHLFVRAGNTAHLHSTWLNYLHR